MFMYNEEIKNKYIKIKENATQIQDDSLIRFFKKTEVIEEEKNKDVSLWTKEEIIDFYELLQSTSYGTLENLHYQLKNYTEWIINNDIFNLPYIAINNYKIIGKREILSCVVKGKEVYSYSDICAVIDLLKNPSDKFIVLAFFEGLKGNYFVDIIEATTEMFRNGYFINGETKIKVSKDLEKLALKSAETTDYITLGSTQKRVELVGERNRIIKNYCNLRGSNSPFTKRNRLTRRWERICDYVGWNNVSINKIYQSGLIYFINEKLKENQMNFKEYIYSKKFDEDCLEKYGKEKIFTYGGKINFYEMYKVYFL